MFSLPFISAVPIPSIFGGTMIVPAEGALFAAVLIAALVGSGLGVLRQATSPHTRSSALCPAGAPPVTDHEDHQDHREAA